MEFIHLSGEFSVCQLADVRSIDWSHQPLFVAVTGDEVSLVCESSRVPMHVLAREDGWAMLKIAGVLEFSLVGVLAHVASLLAEKEISIFASSTYNTDYILVKIERLADAIRQLRSQGHQVTSL